ncbi:MAG: hypothetical protein A2338_02195 [Bacteroidetes bacterium RIFOXYB12_FULL_41_6]|nr:MAG: hypothetical protein A2338_02195 [Bacteroidetes bacterium RIFOXYB12_FULL_41_6]
MVRSHGRVLFVDFSSSRVFGDTSVWLDDAEVHALFICRNIHSSLQNLQGIKKVEDAKNQDFLLIARGLTKSSKPDSIYLSLNDIVLISSRAFFDIFRI